LVFYDAEKGLNVRCWVAFDKLGLEVPLDTQDNQSTKI